MPDGFGFRKRIERTLYDCYGTFDKEMDAIHLLACYFY